MQNQPWPGPNKQMNGSEPSFYCPNCFWRRGEKLIPPIFPRETPPPPFFTVSSQIFISSQRDTAATVVMLGVTKSIKNAHKQLPK